MEGRLNIDFLEVDWMYDFLNLDKIFMVYFLEWDELFGARFSRGLSRDGLVVELFVALMLGFSRIPLAYLCGYFLSALGLGGGMT